MTLLELAIRKLASEGIHEIIVNVHHHSGQVIDYLRTNRFGNVEIAISDETDHLLDTGGAILKTQWFLDGTEPFLVHNVDVISNLSLKTLLNDHMERNALATLSVIDRSTKRYFLFDDELRLRGWTDTATGEVRLAGSATGKLQKLAFSGIHIISPEIFKLMQAKGRFSIIDTYLDLAARYPIHGYEQPGMTWFDLGKPDQVESVSKYLADHPEFQDNL
jgi:NDP-sugar pyrophosphorylase family protein